MGSEFYHSLRLALTAPGGSASSGGALLLEQEAMDPYIGQLTKIAALGWLRKMIFGTDAPIANCPGDGTGYKKAIYAYPSPENLAYRLYLSHGQMTGPVIERREVEQLLQCNLELSPPLKYPALSITSAAWEGETYNAHGELVPAPLINISGGSLRLSAKVYGSLRLTYLVCRHTYIISVFPRQEYGENKLQTFAFGVWSGGHSDPLEIEAPATAEDGVCNSRWNPGTGIYDYTPAIPGSGTAVGNDSGDDEDNPFRPVDGEDEERNIDYCSQEEL